jgi:hypothetical protein
LNRELGGKSVKPYQPEGLWEINSAHYKPDSTDLRNKRSLYMLIKRSTPPPGLQILDSPDRSYCISRRQRTTNPLQALLVWNDPVYREACKKLAINSWNSLQNPDACIEHLFVTLASRLPTPKERSLLLTFWESEHNKNLKEPKRLDAWLKEGMIVNQNESVASEIKAMAMVANLILNSDAVWMKR